MDFNDAVNALSALYDLTAGDARSRLREVADRLELKRSGSSPIWSQIVTALDNRKKNKPAAMDALRQLQEHDRVVTELTRRTHLLQGRFIALFAAHKIEAACYHFYGHGIEMAQDPGDFLRVLAPKGINSLIQTTTNALGAAHDIIQGRGAPTNEKESAEIFKIEAQAMITQLIDEYKDTWTGIELEALKSYRDKTIPFLAEECIVNSTYLLFNVGKRDFDTLLTQVHRAMESYGARPDLDPLIAGMKLSIAVADTRRSEMIHVLRRTELLDSIPAEQVPALEKLLKEIGFLKADQTLRALKIEQKMAIEGFLLRIGQNIRMTTELAVAYPKAGEKVKALERLALIRGIRSGEKTGDSVTVEHIDAFLECIPGERDFAGALGEIDSRELRDHATFYGLSIKPSMLDLTGWIRHTRDLEKTHTFLASRACSPEEKRSIAQMLFTVAAKPPGHRVSDRIYKDMERVAEEWGAEASSTLLGEMKEIRLANPSLTTLDPKARLGLFSLPKDKTSSHEAIESSRPHSGAG